MRFSEAVAKRNNRAAEFVMPGLDPGIHAYLGYIGRRGWPGLGLRPARPWRWQESVAVL